MPTLHITRGIPGSGKTYWARSWVAEDAEKRVRVNRDDLRQMLTNGVYVKGLTERQVLTVRDSTIVALLRKGTDVVCDDTCLPQRTVRDLAGLARQAGAGLQVHDFTHVPLDLCIQRDAARDKPVTEAVIRSMHSRFLRGQHLPLPMPETAASLTGGAPLYEAKPGTPKTILVDVDGTVALMGDRRRPYDWARVGEDLPNIPVIEAVWAMFDMGYRVAIMSGRDEVCREATEAWLHEYLGVPYTGPFMRPRGDTRKDSIVKAELFDQHIRDVFDVRFVLDDRNQVVSMYRGMGLTVFQVADGNF